MSDAPGPRRLTTSLSQMWRLFEGRAIRERHFSITTVIAYGNYLYYTILFFVRMAPEDLSEIHRVVSTRRLLQHDSFRSSPVLHGCRKD